MQTWGRKLASSTSSYMRINQWCLQDLEEVGARVTPTQFPT